MGTMTATTTSSPATEDRTRWSVWTCPNCRHVTSEPRKRCKDCGTSRY